MTDPTLTRGLDASQIHVVDARHTAAEIGSGSLPVLATPVVLAWLEQACCEAVDGRLPVGSTSVGTRVSIEHLRASPVGASVEARATLIHVDDRLLRFEVVAMDASPDAGGGPLAHGEATRVVVDEERFLARLR